MSFTIRLTTWGLIGLAALASTASAEDVATFTKQLADRSAETRAAAADGLGHLGAESASAAKALAGLVQKDADDAVRWRAARALGSIGSGAKSAAPALVAALGDKSPLVRAHAANSLSLVGIDKADVSKLARGIKDKDPRVRRAALASLKRLKLGPDAGLALAKEALTDADHQIKTMALMSIAEYGEEAVPLLTKMLAEPETRYWACLGLGTVGPAAKSAVEPLIEAAADDDPQVRQQALHALGEIRPDSAAAAEAAKAALADEVTAVRYAAIFALASIGGASESAAPDLMKNLESDDPFLRTISAWALARIKPDDKKALDASIAVLVSAMDSDERSVSLAACRALGDLKHADEHCLNCLIEGLDGANPEMAAEIGRTLLLYGEQAVSALAGALKNEATRGPAALILSRIEEGTESAVPQLIAALADDRAEVRREVILALAAVGPNADDAIPALTKALSDEEPRVQYAATYALGRIGPEAKDSLDAIAGNLAAEDEALQAISAWSLIYIAPLDPRIAAESVPRLLKAISNENPVFRREAARGLGDAGIKSKDITAALDEATQDADEQVREVAAEALSKLGE